MTTAIFKIDGMDCAACVVSIDGLLEEAKGVKEARTNYAKAQTTVLFDPAHISAKQLHALIEQTGYKAERL